MCSLFISMMLSGAEPRVSTSDGTARCWFIARSTHRLQDEFDCLVMRIGRAGAGDLVVAAFLFGIASDPAVNIGPDAATGTRRLVPPAQRHFIPRQEATPI